MPVTGFLKLSDIEGESRNIGRGDDFEFSIPSPRSELVDRTMSLGWDSRDEELDRRIIDFSLEIEKRADHESEIDIISIDWNLIAGDEHEIEYDLA